VIDPAPEPLLPEPIDEGLKGLASRLKALARQLGSARGEALTWDLRGLRQRLPDLLDDLTATVGLVQEFSSRLSAFETPEFGPAVENYASLLRSEAGRLGMELTGEYPEFQAFPVELHLNLAQEQVRIGKRSAGTLEPRTIVARLQKEKSRLDRSSFNAQRFMKTLVSSYDLLIRGQDPQRKGTSSVRLVAIHDLLTLRTGKGDYSRQAFAFDIYRLRRTSDLIYDGRQLQFEHGRTQGIDVPTGRGTDALNALRVFPVQHDG